MRRRALSRSAGAPPALNFERAALARLHLHTSQLDCGRILGPQRERVRCVWTDVLAGLALVQLSVVTLCWALSLSRGATSHTLALNVPAAALMIQLIDKLIND